MSEVKWIKLSVDIFQNRKIKQIRKLPDGADICLMWLQLMCLAGQINDHGQVYITEDIPYTEETLATEFDLPIQTVKLGLKVFQQFGMIEVTDNFLQLASWERYQSVEKLDKYREYQRNYHREYRAKQKALETSVGTEVPLRKCLRKIDVNPIDIDKEKDIDKDQDKERESKKPARHQYGEYKNVLLSDDDLGKLQSQFPADWQERIERLSSYIASTGKKYKNHLATIRRWATNEDHGVTTTPASAKAGSFWDVPKQDYSNRKGNYFVPSSRSMSYEEYEALAHPAEDEEV